MVSHAIASKAFVKVYDEKQDIRYDMSYKKFQYKRIDLTLNRNPCYSDTVTRFMQVLTL